MLIGDKIKQLRIKMNLTQEELANRCELSKGFISQVERELTSPSITTLTDMLECLGTNLRDFFNETETDKLVFSKEDVFVREDADEGYAIDWLIPNAQKNSIEPIMLRLERNGKSLLYQPFEGEVFGHVLTGTITLNFGKLKHRVKKGESFYFIANNTYFIANNGASATVLMISDPPNF